MLSTLKAVAMNLLKRTILRFSGWVVTMHLKSGHTIRFRVRDYEISKQNGDLVGYQFQGIRAMSGRAYTSVMLPKIDDLAAMTITRSF